MACVGRGLKDHVVPAPRNVDSPALIPGWVWELRVYDSQMCAEVGPGGLCSALVCEAPLSNPTVCPLAGTSTSSQLLLWQLLLSFVLLGPPLFHTRLPNDPSQCLEVF